MLLLLPLAAFALAVVGILAEALLGVCEAVANHKPHGARKPRKYRRRPARLTPDEIGDTIDAALKQRRR